MPSQIEIRRSDAATWTTIDPILASGELGVETDTSRLKVGDGVRHWSSLPYAALDVNTYITVYQLVISPIAPASPTLGMVWIQSVI